MKKIKYNLWLLLAFIMIAVGIGILTMKNKVFLKQNNSDSNTQDSINVLDARDTIPSSWKTYNNLGLTFKYPKTWTKYGEESNVINRTGAVMSIKVTFIDTISRSIFNMAYHLAPYGAEVYKLAEDQYNSSKNSNERDTKQNTVAGNNAIETFTTMSKDIHGKIYDPPLKLIHIVFLDKQKTGAFNLNFNTPAPGSKVEIAKFERLLSTFKFIN